MNSTADDITPLPGNLLSETEANALIEAFHSHFRIYTEGKPLDIPTWVTFPDGYNIDESIFKSSQFLTYDILYFYFENAKKLFQATPSDIQKFFEHRNPWEYKDYYIFDKNLNWCIAATHEDDMILIGNFEG